ncbi:MAG: hypothetical protein AAF670_20225 [Planctomycetota bacterium]
MMFDWLAERSTTGAATWLLAFEAMLGDLAEEADAFGQAAEAVDLGRDLKQKFFKTPRGRIYRTVFLVREQNVYVVRVRGPGQPDLSPDELD